MQRLYRLRLHGSAVNVLHDDYDSGGSTSRLRHNPSQNSVDRPLVAIQKMIGGNYSRNELRYDSLGRVSQVAFPCVYTTLATTCTSWATNNYDHLNRLTRIMRPISSTNSTLQATNYAYEGRSRFVWDWFGTLTTKIMDVNGLLRQTGDGYGYTVTRAYDAAGTLTGITDGAGNTLFSGVTVAYGIKLFITASTDADRRRLVVLHRLLGERYAWKDATREIIFNDLRCALSPANPN